MSYKQVEKILRYNFTKKYEIKYTINLILYLVGIK